MAPDTVEEEAKRLFQSLKSVNWTMEDCQRIAPLTLEINRLKKEQNAIILAHSYQTPDIMYGVGDFIGDSYGLSVLVAKEKAKKIIFCSVHFMGETAKLLNPEKEVIVPAVAGCSLAEAITPEDVRQLKKEYPGRPVVCYVNTSAAVKAECDVCVTSANVVKIVEALPDKEVIFVPDELMGRNLQNMTSKKIILWKGRCIVHDEFDADMIKQVREIYPGVKILAHTECTPAIIDLVDMAGGTTKMLDYVANAKTDTFMLVTECGLTDRVRTEFKDKKIVGTCTLCPYMKKITLESVLDVLKNPAPQQIITIPDEVALKARKTLDRMFELEKKYNESTLK